MTTAFTPVAGALLRRRLTEIVHRVLSDRERAPDLTQAMCASMSFAALGMDSLAGAELTADIEDALGIELSPSAVFTYPDVESLARFIEEESAVVIPNGQAYTPAPAHSPRSRRLARMLDDAALPADIAPSRTVPLTRDALVTGATGFVGAHLVRAFLLHTDARVFCLVRDRGGDPLGRVREVMRRHEVWDDAFASRLDVVPGDVSRPSLGLSADAFTELASSIGEIYHAAADVDWIQPYEALRDANVIGTRELLRLACTGPAKPFHFVSSLGVCYGTDWREAGIETDDPIDGLAGLHLGYAQSKCVAEALVREAERRGLPVTIVRPALISGDSRSGVSNADDLVSLFIRGCIRMGAAPDLDWVMDSVPADHAAEAMVRLAARQQPDGRVHHLSNPSSRHWRECVLWMRLRGYPLELVSYREWTTRLRVAAAAPDHPLHTLRSFFLGTVEGQGGLSFPELYEESRRRPVRSDATHRTLRELGVSCPRLDARLLDRYFASYVERGVLGQPQSVGGSVDQWIGGSGTAQLSARSFRSTDPPIHRSTGWRSMTTATRMSSDDSIVAELTSWRRGTSAGLYATQDTVIKIKPRDRDVIEIGSHVAHLCGASLGDAYDTWQEHTGFTLGHVRELAVYEHAPDRARPFMPALRATNSDPEREEWLLAIERVTDAAVINAWDRPWTSEEIEAALSGLAQVHAAWLERRTEWADADWLPPARTPAIMTGMRPLWRELAENARPMLDRWAGPELGAVHNRLVNTIDEWWPAAMSQPRTLIHNDFNPRNILLRRVDGALRLCAFDWELATVGAPQRDIAEFLCFALDPERAEGDVASWVERSRLLFEQASSLRLDPQSWTAGFRAATGEVLIDRVAMYAMLHRIRPQAFLPRVARTWLAIHRRAGSTV